jgi:hypothetical protein
MCSEVQLENIVTFVCSRFIIQGPCRVSARIICEKGNSRSLSRVGLSIIALIETTVSLLIKATGCQARLDPPGRHVVKAWKMREIYEQTVRLESILHVPIWRQVSDKLFTIQSLRCKYSSPLHSRLAVDYS